ncbi:CesD/SycD/LcrH family type III secretion system chaperone [Shewanella sp. 202IG2-18]|uniref:CesD/SycD/LcrH family type III secretion system chaperone n=1 Tax=Parashewanella hymeniacidonis TaxID=2807618 RepID=UPI001961DCCC|nr:CesD/SycD/LcrH family type III secretion system chaperone [Parashewanella hymeniacidonis]MBM7071145.1 CesD/SycD/LcrH family type III secretion system chaperone [Parashewanella hymeniacidonis]
MTNKEEADLKIDLKKLEKACEQALSEHKTLAEIKNITPKELEVVYAKGLEKYNAGKPDEAMTEFTYLVMHMPWDRRFQMALGSTLHWLGEFKHALNFYGYALVMDACDPGATFRIGQCFLSLGDEPSAREALQTAIDQSYIRPDEHHIGEQARKLLDELNGR